MNYESIHELRKFSSEKSFGRITLEKLSDKFHNFGGKTFGQLFSSQKLSNECFQQ